MSWHKVSMKHKNYNANFLFENEGDVQELGKCLKGLFTNTEVFIKMRRSLYNVQIDKKQLRNLLIVNPQCHKSIIIIKSVALINIIYHSMNIENIKIELP